MAILVDTSVWINHLRKSDPTLIEKLETQEILIHSAVIGEIAAGNLKNRTKILGDLKRLQRIPEIPPEEIFEFIEIRRLFGKGLSWIDIQILASCLIEKCELFTYDSQLNKEYFGLS